MAGYCQKCGTGFSEPGPLCCSCIPDGCNVAGLSALACGLGMAARGKPFSRQHIFNMTVDSVFDMPVVSIKGERGVDTFQNIYCTHVNTAIWEYERSRAKGNSKKKFNLPHFKTAVSSCSYL